MSSHPDFGSPVADIERYLAASSDTAEPAETVAAPAVESPPHPRRRRTTLLVVSLVVAVAVGGGLGALRPTPAPTAQPPPSAPAGIGGFAELFVATYLSGAGAGADGVLAGFMVEPSAVAAMTPMDRYVSRAAAIDVEPLDADYWSVTVAAEVLERTDAGYVAVGIEHYQVAVGSADDHFVAAAIPARVAGPSARTQPPQPTLIDEPPDEITVFVKEFLDALLVGTHRLSRYTVPGSSIRAIVPHPYRAVTIVNAATGIADGKTYVEATIEATTDRGMVHVLGYTLELASDGGGEWEVAAILPGPPTAGRGASAP